MEFKFRAAEAGASNNIPPNASTTTMFTRQNLRGAVLSNDNVRTQPELERNPVSSDAIQREIEKRQIREEILAAEIIRRRELEAEVRRELMEERAVSKMGAENQGFSFYNSSAVPTPLSRSELMGMLPLAYQNESVINPAQLKSPAVRLLPQTNAEQVNPMNSTVAGMKRKAETLATGGSKKQQDGWTCDLCGVSTTDERSLQTHREGKKHKAKENKQKASILRVKCEQAVSTGSLNPKPEESSNEKEIMMRDGLLPDDMTQQRMKCWCQMCKFETNSEAELMSHMMGQMHRALLQENGGCVIAISTLPEYAAIVDKERSLNNAEETKQKAGKEGEMSIPLVLPVGETTRLKVDDKEESGEKELSGNH